MRTGALSVVADCHFVIRKIHAGSPQKLAILKRFAGLAASAGSFLCFGWCRDLVAGFGIFARNSFWYIRQVVVLRRVNCTFPLAGFFFRKTCGSAAGASVAGVEPFLNRLSRALILEKVREQKS